MRNKSKRIHVRMFNLVRALRVLNASGLSLRVRIRSGGGRDCYPAFWISLVECDFNVSDLYASLYGGRIVPISETPHVEFLRSRERGIASSAYRDYRGLKFPAGTPAETAFERSFLDLAEKVRARDVESIIQINVAKGDSIPIIIDGLHRASVVYVQDSKASVRCIFPMFWIVVQRLG